MATVYLGRALGMQGFERLVAIKVMHPHLADDPEFVGMFLDEARLAARVLHPNVVSTHDVQKGPDGLFIVMDYVPGPSLKTLLRVVKKREEHLPPRVVMRIMLDALTGLHAAHDVTDAEGNALNIIHRDVSPDNVLVGTDGLTRLTDFGIARVQAKLGTTRGGHIKGKLSYVAPEQVLYGKADQRCDVYAAGVSLWEALTARKLFEADTDGVLLSMVMEGASQSPRDVNPAVPEPVAKACMRALAVNPDERYPTAADFASDLERAARFSVGVATARDVSLFLKGLAEDLDATATLPEQRLFDAAARDGAGAATDQDGELAPQQDKPADVSPTAQELTAMPARPASGRGMILGLVAGLFLLGLVVVYAIGFRSTPVQDSLQQPSGAVPVSSDTPSATASVASTAPSASESASAAPTVSQAPTSPSSTSTKTGTGKHNSTSTATGKGKSGPYDPDRL